MMIQEKNEGTMVEREGKGLDIFTDEDCFEELIDRPSLFREEGALDVNHASEILHRRDEIARLFGLYSTLINRPGEYAVNQIVSGAGGVGKTATIKFFCSRLESIASERGIELHYVHVNCRKQKTGYNVLVRIIRSFDPSFPNRGHAREDVLMALKDHLVVGNAYLLLVLDELDVLIKDDQDTLYQLLRFDDDSQGTLRRVSVIGIVRHLSVFQEVDARLLDYLQRSVITFRPYDEGQLFDILWHKARSAFLEGVIEQEVVRHVVSRIKPEGNLRRGMGILWRAGKMAEHRGLSKVTRQCVEKAMEDAFPSSRHLDYLSSLSTEKLVFLLGIARSKVAHGKELGLKDVTPSYEKLCSRVSINPRSPAQLWNYLQDYENARIVEKKVRSKGIKGRRTLITIPHDLLPNLEAYLEDLLEAKGVII